MVVGVLLAYIFLTERGFSLGGKTAIYFWTPNSVLEVLLSISLFLCFERVNLPYNRMINRIASCTLGMYMLHDGALRSVWWGMVFKNASHRDSRFFLIHIAIAVAGIMALGILCEIPRQFLESRIVMPTVAKVLCITKKGNDGCSTEQRIG